LIFVSGAFVWIEVPILLARDGTPGLQATLNDLDDDSLEHSSPEQMRAGARKLR
jgi:hypothetical protein